MELCFPFFACVSVCGVYREESDLHYIAHHKTLKACRIKRTDVSDEGGESN